MSEQSFFTGNKREKFISGLSAMLLTSLLRVHGIALSDGTATGNSAKEARKALSAAVRPVVNLLFNAHEECLREISNSLILQHLLSAYVHQNPTLDSAQARVELIEQLTALSLDAAVRQVLIASDAELAEQAASSTTASLAAIAIMERVDGITPVRSTPAVLIKSSSDAAKAVPHYFLTSGGTTLVSTGGTMDEKEISDEASGEFWSSLHSLRPTPDEVESARAFIAAGVIERKGGKLYDLRGDAKVEITSEEEERRVEANPESDQVGTFRIVKSGIESYFKVRSVSQTEIVLRRKTIIDDSEDVHLRTNVISDILQPETGEFAVMPIDEFLIQDMVQELEKAIAPAFQSSGISREDVLSLTQQFVLKQEPGSVLNYRKAKPDPQT
jgi:hypothetical protein